MDHLMPRAELGRRAAIAGSTWPMAVQVSIALPMTLHCVDNWTPCAWPQSHFTASAMLAPSRRVVRQCGVRKVWRESSGKSGG